MLFLLLSTTFLCFSVLQMFHHHHHPLPLPTHHHTSQYETIERVPTYLQDWGCGGRLMDEGGGEGVLEGEQESGVKY